MESTFELMPDDPVTNPELREPYEVPSDTEIQERSLLDSQKVDGMDLEACGSCLTADAELEIHGERMIVTCPCGNYGPVRHTQTEAREGWNEQNAGIILWRSVA
jgi:hypothetical protein